MKGAGNTTFSFNGTALTAYCNKSDLDSTASELETTDFASTAEESEPGLTKHVINVGGDWSKAVDDVFAPQMATPTLVTSVLTVGSGADEVTYTWTSKSFASNYKWDAGGPNQKITWSAKITCSGNPVRS